MTPLRVGLGEDTHRTQPGGPLRLGGVTIPHHRSLDGHSDADVLLHAVTDAILGAANLPDIGELFPNTDPANRGRDSGELLKLAAAAARESGYEIINLDCVVSAQEPKISPHKMAIRSAIAALLGIEVEQVGVKAKTGEHVGPVGRGEAIEARCVVLVECAG